ncbi:uncharacterized protein N7479_006631 [Penicillium vulpinum]|uniref:uncharacterized protein n=1 Tax=Penicillium vulpinum TaxID=29845 RepID=UPI0025492E45|nr:uncharacterized protein N7479_006631 [Penicillium vulpinum]KAJ5959481.1 hypothetical protein N7479_006631 [Penicillium vulpinum]
MANDTRDVVHGKFFQKLEWPRQGLDGSWLADQFVVEDDQEEINEGSSKTGPNYLRAKTIRAKLHANCLNPSANGPSVPSSARYLRTPYSVRSSSC